MEDVQKDVQQFHSLHPNRKLAILGIIALVFIISVGIGITLSNNGGFNGTAPGGDPTTPGTETDTAQTAVMMVADTNQLGVGESANIAVMLDNTPVQAVDIVITYDPSILSADDIINGSVYPDILRSEVTDGQVVVSAAVDPSDPTNLTTGELFSFTVTALAAGDGTLTFDPDLTITAKSGVNTLGSASPLTVSVK